MQHLEIPIFIKSATDGERLREQIRQEREQVKRDHARFVAEIEATLREAETTLARLSRTK